MTALRRRFEEIEGREAVVRDQIAVLQAELAGLRAEKHSLAKRMAAPTATDEPPVTRTERVRRILEKASTPMSPAEVVGALEAGEHEASAADVGGTLAHLKREGHATTVGHGQWVATSS